MTEPTAHSTEDLDRALRRIKAMLAQADDPSVTPAEAEAHRTRAEMLMHKYRVDENMLLLRGGKEAEGIVPVWRTIRVCRYSSEFASTYRFMAANAVSHVGGKAAVGSEVIDGEYWMTMECVGYESDLRYADVIFTAMSLAFATKMEPKADPNLSDQENAYAMRSAGMEGWKISMALWGKQDKASRSKARRLFAKEAEARGEDASALLGQGNRVEVFRASYAQGFETEMYRRLARMRQGTGTDGAMVLKSRSENVLEAYYERFPHLRPGPVGERKEIGVTGGPNGTCEKCKKASSGYCRDHGYLRPRKSDYKATPFSEAGYARGAVAAQHVDLGGTERRVQGGDTRAIG